MAATGTGRTTRKTTTRKKPGAAPARQAMQVPNPPPPLSETFGRGPAGQADTPGEPGPLDTGTFEPVRLSSKPPKDSPQAARITLFYIDDQPYTIPAKPSTSDALEFLHFASRFGIATAEQAKDLPLQAIDFLMTLSLGENGWRDLRQCKTIETDEFLKITEICTTVMLGRLELPKGPGSA